MVAELHVETTHDETDDSLWKQSKNHGVLWPEIVDDERSDEGSGHIKQVDDNTPSKNNRQWSRISNDAKNRY